MNNPVQFAVVREDPMVEKKLVELYEVKNLLLIASGGCTALTLRAHFPELGMTLIDANPAQLELIRQKINLLSNTNQYKQNFNIGVSNSSGLNQCGNFESLFRGLREFIFDLVASESQVRQIFETKDGYKQAQEVIFSNKYWPIAFDLFFSDKLLNTMFGSSATQYARPGSYPRYFQNIFEKGCSSKNAHDNYFLHHVLVGHYFQNPSCLPDYLVKPLSNHRFQLVEGNLLEATNLSDFDMISLSNITDWMTPSDVNKLIHQLQNQMKRGGIILYRQLNNFRDLEVKFGNTFRFETDLGAQLLHADRSLFYSSIHVGRKK